MTLHTGSAPPRARTWRIWVLLLVAVVSAIALAFPYLGIDAGTSRIPVRDGAHHVLLVVHIFTAAVALVLGPLQFIPALRQRRLLHRTIGRTYLLAGVLPSALSGIPVAIVTDSPVTRYGLLIPCAGWLVTGWLAFRAARGHRFAEHREWMLRNYALTFLAVTSRVVVPLMLLAQAPFFDQLYDGSAQAAVEATIPIGQWAGWIINLIIVEVLIRKRRSRTIPA